MLPIDERYHNDPVFHRLVDTLGYLLEQGNTTPTELREALMLAQLQFERRRPRVMVFANPEAQVRADAILRGQLCTCPLHNDSTEFGAVLCASAQQAMGTWHHDGTECVCACHVRGLEHVCE